MILVALLHQVTKNMVFADLLTTILPGVSKLPERRELGLWSGLHDVQNATCQQKD